MNWPNSVNSCSRAARKQKPATWAGLFVRCLFVSGRFLRRRSRIVVRVLVDIPTGLALTACRADQAFRCEPEKIAAAVAGPKRFALSSGARIPPSASCRVTLRAIQSMRPDWCRCNPLVTAGNALGRAGQVRVWTVTVKRNDLVANAKNFGYIPGDLGYRNDPIAHARRFFSLSSAALNDSRAISLRSAFVAGSAPSTPISCS